MAFFRGVGLLYVAGIVVFLRAVLVWFWPRRVLILELYGFWEAGLIALVDGVAGVSGDRGAGSFGYFVRFECILCS